VWLRENAPELLEVGRDDEAALAKIGEKFFQQYGEYFVVRFGRNRMKNFRSVLEEAPNFVSFIESQVSRNAAAKGMAWPSPESAHGVVEKNKHWLVSFAKQRQSKEQATASSGASEAPRKQKLKGPVNGAVSLDIKAFGREVDASL
ncbi:unnamed protein product, partial [Symbiodinium pilosum]